MMMRPEGENRIEHHEQGSVFVSRVRRAGQGDTAVSLGGMRHEQMRWCPAHSGALVSKCLRK